MNLEDSILREKKKSQAQKDKYLWSHLYVEFENFAFIAEIRIVVARNEEWWRKWKDVSQSQQTFFYKTALLFFIRQTCTRIYQIIPFCTINNFDVYLSIKCFKIKPEKTNMAYVTYVIVLNKYYLAYNS
jgi:hypothetical protein